MPKVSLQPRPRLACEVSPDQVVAARAADSGRVSMFSSRRLKPGALMAGLAGPNIFDEAALRSAITGALGGVAGGARDVIAIVPDAAVRIVLLDFETLPKRAQEVEPVVRFRLKKSLPFDVEQAALSFEVRTVNGTVQVVAAITPRSILDEYEAAFRHAGYAPGFVLPSTLAILGLVNGNSPTLLFKADATHLTIAGAQNGELRLIRTIDNAHGENISAADMAEVVLPSVVFFEDTFGQRIESIFLGGIGPIPELGPMLHQQTGARVEEILPDMPMNQNISGESVSPFSFAGVAGALIA